MMRRKLPVNLALTSRLLVEHISSSYSASITAIRYSQCVWKIKLKMSRCEVTSNGVVKAERLGFGKLQHKFRSIPEHLAAIDYGTTHVSVSYVFRPDLHLKQKDINSIMIPLNDSSDNFRVPNCMLFDKEGKLIKFGYEARRRYLRHQDCYYFERVKKVLRHDTEEEVDRYTYVQAANGSQFYLLDVIAHALHYVKAKVMREVGCNFDLSSTHIDWVITVPAIWNDKGRKLMREAGYMAGLCSPEKSPPPLKPVGAERSQSISLPELEEIYPDRLSLALEPESAAIKCQQDVQEMVRSKGYRFNSDSYLVVDIGGATVDISTHSIVDDHIEELHTATGNYWGGTTVNEAFKSFLEDFVEDRHFTKYKDQIPNADAELNKFVYTDFDIVKCEFGGSEEPEDEYILDIPATFRNVYKQKLLQNTKTKHSYAWISCDGYRMTLSCKQTELFFRPSINGIISKLRSHLSQLSRNDRPLHEIIDTILLVGAYGGSYYLRKELISALERDFQVKFPLIMKPGVAVVQGALVFRVDPSVVRKRKADATYGIQVWKKKEDGSGEYHKNLFSHFVEVGDSVCTNEVFVNTHFPIRENQESMSLEIFSSPNRDVYYTTDPGVTQLGNVCIPLGGYGLDRQVEVILDITHTEIQMRARDKIFEIERKTVVDFLCSKSKW